MNIATLYNLRNQIELLEVNLSDLKNIISFSWARRRFEQKCRQHTISSEYTIAELIKLHKTQKRILKNLKKIL